MFLEIFHGNPKTGEFWRRLGRLLKREFFCLLRVVLFEGNGIFFDEIFEKFGKPVKLSFFLLFS